METLTFHFGERTTLTAKDVEYAFRWCPAGTFMMGSPEGEEGRLNDESQHQVTLTHGFWMMETHVTQGMWQSVMGNNPSKWKGKRLPAEQVSWNNCLEYVKKLNTLGVTPAGYRFSLPTETQWEYACRAGTMTPYHFGSVLNGGKANCDGNYPYGTDVKGNCLGKPAEAGLYPANAWGLLDMHGNVWEWCLDWYGSYPNGSVTDPAGPANGLARVLRGGSWLSDARYCRSANRRSLDPASRNDIAGFRLVLVREPGDLLTPDP